MLRPVHIVVMPKGDNNKIQKRTELSYKSAEFLSQAPGDILDVFHQCPTKH